MSLTPRQQIVVAYLEKYEGKPTMTIARIMQKENPLDFGSLEVARMAIRNIRGEAYGKKKGKPIDKYKRTMEEKKQSQAWAGVPKTEYEPQLIFKIPKGNNRILVLSDIHLPYHDEQALQIAIDWAVERKPNAILLNGDTMDMYHASRFIKDRRLRDLGYEIEMTRQFLKDLKELFDCTIYFKLGNHEDRWENYLKTVAPELLGINDFELKNVLRFGELGVTEVKSKQTIKAGNLHILHGHEFGHSVFSPVNPARGLYMRAKASSMIGHHHQSSEHSEKDLKGDVVTCWSIGCLCGLQPDYMPYNKWNHGFAWVEVFAKGDFEVKNLRIIDGKVR
jgi:predicted phosphodiesterase